MITVIERRQLHKQGYGPLLTILHYIKLQCITLGLFHKKGCEDRMGVLKKATKNIPFYVLYVLHGEDTFSDPQPMKILPSQRHPPLFHIHCNGIALSS